MNKRLKRLWNDRVVRAGLISSTALVVVLEVFYAIAGITSHGCLASRILTGIITLLVMSVALIWGVERTEGLELSLPQRDNKVVGSVIGGLSLLVGFWVGGYFVVQSIPELVRIWTLTSDLRKPSLPIAVTDRASLVGSEFRVLQLHNQTAHQVTVRLDVRNKTSTRSAHFSANVPPNGTQELGMFQVSDWDFRPGDIITLSNEQYSDLVIRLAD